MIKDDKSESVCSMDNETLVNGRKERRQHKRIVVENMGVDCDMPSASRVKVINISGGGALVMADRVINIGKTYALKIGFKNRTVFVKATAIWALLADSVKEPNGDTIPLYIAGMKFVDVIRGDIQEIIKLLDSHVDGNMYDAFIGNLQGNAYSCLMG
jgi:hypothetical protein